MSGVGRYGYINSVIPKEGCNEVFDGCRRHEQSAAGVSRLPFHPVSLDGGEDGFRGDYLAPSGFYEWGAMICAVARPGVKCGN